MMGNNSISGESKTGGGLMMMGCLVAVLFVLTVGCAYMVITSLIESDRDLDLVNSEYLLPLPDKTGTF